MKISIPIEYQDSKGTVKSELVKEGDTLTMILRGVRFTEINHKGFMPAPDTNPLLMNNFTTTNGPLFGYSIKFLETPPRVFWGRQEEKFRVLNVLLDELDSEIPVDDQLDKLEPLKSITDDQVEMLVSYGKDPEAGMALNFIGPSRMGLLLSKLLEKLQDMNDPAFHWNMKLLTDIGEILVPEIKKVFSNEPNDSIWHQNIIRMLDNWETPLLLQLKTELVDTILKADFEGASISALGLLYSRKLITVDETEEFFKFLEEKYDSNNSSNETTTIETKWIIEKAESLEELRLLKKSLNFGEKL